MELFLLRLRGRCPRSGRRGLDFTALPPSTHAFGVAHFPRKRGKNNRRCLMGTPYSAERYMLCESSSISLTYLVYITGLNAVTYIAQIKSR